MTANDTWRRDLWAATSRALTAHVVMLRDTVTVDDRRDHLWGYEGERCQEPNVAFDLALTLGDLGE